MTLDGPYDALLRWVSEQSSGSWGSFREAHDWLFARSQLRPPRAWVTASTLASLGHMEVDWDSQRWAASRPCLITLPAAGAIALLVGARPKELEHRFWRLADGEAPPELFASASDQARGPRALFLQYGAWQELERLGAALRVPILPRAAEVIGNHLPDTDTLIQQAPIAAPPPRTYEVEEFDVETLSWSQTTQGRSPSLLRYRVPGAERYLLRDGPDFRRVSREAGIWHVVGQAGRQLVRHIGDTVNGDLSLPVATRLPMLQARAAVLSSGLVPGIVDGRLSFPNVPRPLALRIAGSIGQRLDEVGHEPHQ